MIRTQPTSSAIAEISWPPRFDSSCSFRKVKASMFLEERESAQGRERKAQDNGTGADRAALRTVMSKQQVKG